MYGVCIKEGKSKTEINTVGYYKIDFVSGKELNG